MGADCILRPETSLLIFFLRFYLFIFRERGREEERGGEKHHWLPLASSQMGTWPKTQACALTENQTSDLSVRRPALNPLIHPSQGSSYSRKILTKTAATTTTTNPERKNFPSVI